eukprot:CAMPEP_0170584750 /NCGR_PEP_ID=MMETSP0224-20130122/8846_1 /TAXON_ID=285029 /ORGANISM="Togula jolla, Strain CCCM 725" /LENGTH=424 /DNA_ID=CAMNT_0010908187 /DNA_START=172 /DNA_END=1446 /DNA_ORIENTATION=+
MVEKSGPVFATFLLFEWTFSVSGGSNIRKVMHGEGTLVEAEWPPGTKRLLGEHSLAVQSGQVHSSQRRLMLQAFRPEALARYVPEIVAITQRSIDLWLQKVSILGHKEVKTYAFEIAAVALLHFKFDEAQLTTMMARFAEYTDGLFAPPIEIPGLQTSFSKALKAREYLLGEIEKALVEREGLPGVKDALQLMMDSVDPETGEKLTRAQLKDQALLQLFAGHDTTTSSMTSMLYYLGTNPGALEAARREQDEILKVFAEEESFSTPALASMPYLDAVIREVLRLRPPVGGGFRRAIKSFELEGKDGPVQIPIGSKLSYSISLTHSTAPIDAREKFEPERWLSCQDAQEAQEGQDGAGANRDYAPFAAGKRKCLGFPLAEMELKIFGAIVLRRMSFTLTNPSGDYVHFPIPRPRDFLPMTVTARK